MTAITYDSGLPPEVRAAIEPHIEKWKHILPAWCHRLSVLWDDDDTGGALSTEAHYEYRRATLNVLPNFLTVEDRRETNVVHELLHVTTDPMTTTMRALAKALVEKVPDLETWADEQIRLANESAVCDLARAMLMFAHPTQ